MVDGAGWDAMRRRSASSSPPAGATGAAGWPARSIHLGRAGQATLTATRLPGGGTVPADLSRATFIDSSGLGRAGAGVPDRARAGHWPLVAVATPVREAARADRAGHGPGDLRRPGGGRGRGRRRPWLTNSGQGARPPPALMSVRWRPASSCSGTASRSPRSAGSSAATTGARAVRPGAAQVRALRRPPAASGELAGTSGARLQRDGPGG